MVLASYSCKNTSVGLYNIHFCLLKHMSLNSHIFHTSSYSWSWLEGVILAFCWVVHILPFLRLDQLSWDLDFPWARVWSTQHFTHYTSVGCIPWQCLQFNSSWMSFTVLSLPSWLVFVLPYRDDMAIYCIPWTWLPMPAFSPWYQPPLPTRLSMVFIFLQSRHAPFLVEISHLSTTVLLQPANSGPLKFSWLCFLIQVWLFGRNALLHCWCLLYD